MPRGRTLAIGLASAALLALPAPGASAAPAGSTLLVSRPDGTGSVPPAFDNNSQTPGAVSADGRYVAYTSDADGFATGVDPAVPNVLLRDRQTKTTVLVSRSDGMNGAGANQPSSAPAIAIAPPGVMPTAPAGQAHVLVTFISAAGNLVDHASGQPVTAGDQVWLRDVTAGTTTLISRADGVNGAPANGGGVDRDWPGAIAVTPNGPVVAFNGYSTNLGGGGSGVFLRTVLASATEILSCKPCDPTPTAVPASHPAIAYIPGTPGVFEIAFDTSDPAFAGAGGHSQVVGVFALAPGSPGSPAGSPGFGFKISVVSGGSTTFGNGDSKEPAMSSDGQDIAFRSKATNLTTDTLPPGDQYQAFDHSINDTTTVLLSRASGATGAIAAHGAFSVSLGGVAPHLRAAFTAGGADLGATGASDQAWVRDLNGAKTSLLNRSPGAGGSQGDSYSRDPGLSADGQTAVFTSNSGNLGDGGGTHYSRVHLRTLPPSDVSAGTVELLSRPNGTTPFSSGIDASYLGGGASSSAHGRFVVFSSQSTAFAPGAQPNSGYVYVRDLLLGRTILVSRASGAKGQIANGDSTNAGGISADGRYVAFDSNATNLSPQATNGVSQVYIRDLLTNTTTLVSRGSGVAGAPSAGNAYVYSISADGNAVLMDSVSALAPGGTPGAFHLYERNLQAHTSTLVDRDNGSLGAVATQGPNGAALSADGHRVVWATSSALAGAPSDTYVHVYLRDLRDGTTTLVSRADGPAGASAAGDSGSPAIDAAGDVVAFDSYAHNLGATFYNQQVFVRNVSTSHTQLESRIATGGVDFPATAEAPSLDAAGDKLAFSAYGTPFGSPGVFQVLIRDLRSQSLTVASRANGAAGAPGNGYSRLGSIEPTGDCVAFSSVATNLGDGFGSADFEAVHLRVLNGSCPLVPMLSHLKIRPGKVHLRGRHRGATISFSLSVPAAVTLRFDQLRAGRRRGRRCVVGRKHGRRCTVTQRRASITLSVRAGSARVRFTGKVGRRRLGAGRYRLTATPEGGRARSLTFTILR